MCCGGPDPAAFAIRSMAFKISAVLIPTATPSIITNTHTLPARVAKLADAQDLGSCSERSAGSTPAPSIPRINRAKSA